MTPRATSGSAKLEPSESTPPRRWSCVLLEGFSSGFRPTQKSGTTGHTGPYLTPCRMCIMRLRFNYFPHPRGSSWRDMEHKPVVSYSQCQIPLLVDTATEWG